MLSVIHYNSRDRYSGFCLVALNAKIALSVYNSSPALMTQYLRFLSNKTFSYVLIGVLTTATAFAAVFTYLYVTAQQHIIKPSFSTLISLISTDIGILALLLTAVVRHLWIHRYKDIKTSVLEGKMIKMFSIITIVPTVIISFFSIYFFHVGIQRWFDQRITKLLEQSSQIADSYIQEHVLQLQETAFTISKILNQELANNPAQLQNQLHIHSKLRSIDEAVIFNRSTGTIVAQTILSFSLSFTHVPAHLLERARLGEAVPIRSDKNKIRVLIKLGSYNDHYMMIGRLIDRKVLDHIEDASNTVQDYVKLKGRINSLQADFSAAFCMFSLLLVVTAMWVGGSFGEGIALRVRKLLNATQQVKKGDWSIRIAVDPENKPDEISLLSAAFNDMVRQLQHQKQDLIIAQRALAWSDIARRVAHEINNPLTPIQLAAEIIDRKFTDQVLDQASFKRYINIILRHTGDIRKILSEFVHFAKLPNPTFEQCDIVTVVRELVDSRKALKDGITYHFYTSHPHIEFRCDLTQIHQIVVNLLKNAEEALEGIEGPAINLELQRSDEELTLSITDNGRGFPQDSMDKISEAYFTTRASGTGLGLAIVKKLVEDHGGKVEFFNTDHGGACIKLSFPLNLLTNKFNPIEPSN